jgi:hypothetical protein
MHESRAAPELDVQMLGVNMLGVQMLGAQMPGVQMLGVHIFEYRLEKAWACLFIWRQLVKMTANGSAAQKLAWKLLHSRED